jgi:hypothetical protein
VPSLGPGLHDNAIAYDAAIGDINDRVLLTNVLRARDYVPLNITELSSVTGTLSEQASLGLSLPFGGTFGTAPRGTLTPSVQVVAAPTFSMAPLNTRGFTLNIIQPISPVYIASKWNAGIAHELLLLLFVKDIQFADSYAPSLDSCAPLHVPGGSADSSSPQGLVACHHKFINDPDSPGEEKAFRAVIESMLPSVGIKVMTILEPIGPTFPFLARAAREEGVGKDDKKPTAAALQNPLDAYALTTHLGDGQYHVGNDEQDPNRGQLYHVYANQVAVCASDPVKTVDGVFYIYPISADIAIAGHAQKEHLQSLTVPFAKDREDRLTDFKTQCGNAEHPRDHACNALKSLNGEPKSVAGASPFGSYSVVMSALGGSAGNSRVEPADESPGRGRAANSSGAGGSAMPAISASLQENRVGAFLRADDCYADQTVREPTTETEFRKYTETLGHIEWRSIAEVFQYLGAVLRQGGITWHVTQDKNIVGSADGLIPDTLFAVRRADGSDGNKARLKIDYAGEKLGVGSGTLTLGATTLNDQSLLVLSLLSELVNSAKISSDIPVTQQLQVLP